MNSIKKYRNIGGVDLRSPELLRDDATATFSLNASLSENLSLSKRRGSQIVGELRGGLGTATFKNTDIATGIDDKERLVFDNSVWRQKEEFVTITYTEVGPDSFTPSAEVKVSSEDSRFKLYLYLDGDLNQTIDLGTGVTTDDFGIDEALSAIIAPFSYTVPAPYGGQIDASALRVMPITSFDDTLDIRFNYYEEVDSVIANPFQATYDTRNDPDFELLSSVQTRDVLYITSGVDGLFKYDGLKLYKAGLPKPSNILEAANEAGTDTFIYRYVYSHTDNKENTIYSTPSEEYISTNGRITIDFSNMAPIPDGWDKDNIEVIILRSKANLSLQFEVATIPYSDTMANYEDTTPDSALTTDYILPSIPLDKIPSCRYIDVFRDQLVLTGDSEAVHRVYFADVEYPEGFSDLNSFETSTRRGGPNSGVKSQDNFLYIFKAGSITAVTGVLEVGGFQVDTLSDEGVGCLSHQSLVEADGKIWFVSRQGVYSLDSNGLYPESEELDPIFQVRLGKIVTNRIIGYHLVDDKRVIFMLPERSGPVFSHDSLVLSHNMYTGAWDLWNNMDFSAGISGDDREVYFISIKERSDGSIRQYMHEILNTNTELDLADHNEPVYFSREFGWETMGEPSVEKKIHRLKVFSIDSPLRAFTTPNFSLDIETNHNYIDTPVSMVTLKWQELNTGWGVGPWGKFPWGSPRPTQRRTRLNTRKCLSIRLKISNNVLYEDVLVSGIEYEAAPMYNQYMRDK